MTATLIITTKTTMPKRDFNKEPELESRKREGAWAESAIRLRLRHVIARAVLEARLTQGLTQGELAKRAGTKQSRISEIETASGNPRLDTLEKVTSALDLDFGPLSEAIPQQAVLQPEFWANRFGHATASPPKALVLVKGGIGSERTFEQAEYSRSEAKRPVLIDSRSIKIQ